jgi:hypothetical protein
MAMLEDESSDQAATIAKGINRSVREPGDPSAIDPGRGINVRKTAESCERQVAL